MQTQGTVRILCMPMALSTSCWLQQFVQQWRAAANEQKLLTYHQPPYCWSWGRGQWCVYIIYCIKRSKKRVEQSVIVIFIVRITKTIV